MHSIVLGQIDHCKHQTISHTQKKHCHRTLSKKVISNSGFSLIDFCQKNCNSMRMVHALAGHVFFISTNQMQPRCQSCVEFNGGFRGWPLFLLILNPLQAAAKSKCGKLPFSIINNCHHMARHHLLPPTNAPCDSPKSFKNQAQDAPKRPPKGGQNLTST